MTYKLKSGRVLTDEDIERLAEQDERQRIIDELNAHHRHMTTESVLPGSKGTYTVIADWHWRDAPDRLHRDTVHLTPGYTDSSHIPAILAIRYGAGTPDTDKVVIDKLIDLR